MHQKFNVNRPRLRMLQPYLPRQYFDTLHRTLDRHINPTVDSETTQFKTIAVNNPFQRKPDRSTPTYGQTNVHKVATYLERKITPDDFKSQKKHHQPSLRYDKSEGTVHRNPIVKSKATNRRKLVLDKSSKVRSGSIAEYNSPTLNRHPRSSLSNPYEAQNKHRRAVSISRNYASREDIDQNTTQGLMEQGKKYYQQSDLNKAIDVFQIVLMRKNLPEAQYLLAVCFMNNGQPQKAIKTFNNLMEEHPSYRKNVYLLTAIAYKRMNKLDSALSILGKGLIAFPDDYDCMIYRGKLNMKLLNYPEALEDFSKAIEFAPKKGFSYIGKADCLKNMDRIKEAIQTITKGIQTDLGSLAYLKRGTYYYQSKNYNEAINDFQSHLQKDNSSSEGHFHRGMTYLKLANTSEALLSFDQVLKLDNNPHFVSKSLEEIIKIHINQKDFYQAYHVVARAQNLDIDKQEFEQWKTFIEGTLFLMKKKYKQGIEVLTELLIKGYFNQSLSQIPSDYRQKYIFLKPLMHLYRAYGYFSLNDLRSSRLDYSEVDEFANQASIELNQPTKQYNMMLIRAIDGFPDHSTVFLQQAIRLYPNKTQPYLYMALVQTQQYITSEQADVVDKIRSNLDKAVSFLPQLSNNHISNVYCHRAIINLYVNDIDKAISDIDKAIEKSEDNIPKYFYVRGLIFACFANFSQAVQDLSVCINLDSKFEKAYLERAKCLQIEGNPNQAFLDLQKYITLKSEDPFIHKYAGILLFQNGAYEDCLSAFKHGVDMLTDIDILETQAKCKFILGELGDCLKLIEQYTKLEEENIELNEDYMIVRYMKKLEQNKSPEIFEEGVKLFNKIINENKMESKFFKKMDYHLLLASCLASSKSYDAAVEEFRVAVQLKLAQQQKQMEDDSDDEDMIEDYGWTMNEVTYCIVLCFLAKGNTYQAVDLISKVDTNTKKSSNQSWLIQFRKLFTRLEDPNITEELEKINSLRQDSDKLLSKYFPPIPLTIGNRQCLMNLQFQYPQVDPPELLPQFDHELLVDFVASKIEPKPEAPWITRNSNGVVFTPNIQIFDGLELSRTSKKNEQQSARLEDSRPDMSEKLSQVPINKKDLKAHFKLDSKTELKLQRLLAKK